VSIVCQRFGVPMIAGDNHVPIAQSATCGQRLRKLVALRIDHLTPLRSARQVEPLFGHVSIVVGVNSNRAEPQSSPRSRGDSFSVLAHFNAKDQKADRRYAVLYKPFPN